MKLSPVPVFRLFFRHCLLCHVSPILQHHREGPGPRQTKPRVWQVWGWSHGWWPGAILDFSYRCQCPRNLETASIWKKSTTFQDCTALASSTATFGSCLVLGYQLKVVLTRLIPPAQSRTLVEGPGPNRPKAQPTWQLAEYCLVTFRQVQNSFQTLVTLYYIDQRIRTLVTVVLSLRHVTCLGLWATRTA